jgi:glycerophosphoryl diester phosphodiesterase
MDFMGKPKLFFIAHRMNVGSPSIADYNHVDNGMEALDAVLELNADKNNYNHIKGFECDVRLTEDNQLVVVHDANAKTMTTNKYNKNIGDMTYKELQCLEIRNAGLYYSGLKKRALLLPDSKRIRNIITQRLQNTTVVPKAFEMFEYLANKKYDGEIVLELKEASDKNRDATIELVNTYKSILNIVVKSYDAKRTISIGEKTGVRIGLLEAVRYVNKRDPIDGKFIKDMPFDFYSILWSKVNKNIMSSMVENGKELYMWTIDSAAHMFGALKRLESYYDQFGAIPMNTHLITNLPILLEEYISGEKQIVPFTKEINRKYRKLFQSS